MAYRRTHTLLVFVICAAVVGGFALYVYRPASGASTTGQNGTVAVNTSPVQTPLPVTTDWHAQFLSDSSAKGSFKTASAVDTTDSSADDSDQPLSATDELGREFFTNYMQLHEAGLDTDPNAVNTLSGQLVSDGAQDIQTPQTYALSDLHVVDVDDTASLTRYAGSIIGIVNAYIPDQNNNEAVIATQALDQGDTDMSKQLDPVVANYQKALTMLLSMNVPQPLAQYHLELTDGVAIGLYNAKALENVDTDPLTSLGAVSLETTELQTMDAGITGIRQYYASVGLPFNG